METSNDRFTEEARKVLSLAQEEAQRFNHNYIGTEHLLLGLVREEEGVAVQVLSRLGVELNNIRSAVEFIIGRGERTVTGEIGLTPRAKKVLELAKDEARRAGHDLIGTEHVLLGLIREGEGIACGVLESLGVSLEKARSEVIRVLTQTGSEPHRDTGRQPLRTDRWEYLAIETGIAGSMPHVRAVNGKEDPRFTAHQTPVHQALRELGEEGWELAGIDPKIDDKERGALYVFKRPLTP